MTRISKFNSLSFLSQIDTPRFLVPLLQQWAGFFEQHGVQLDELTNDPADDEAIRSALCHVEDMHGELLDTLEMLEDLATPTHRDRIREEAKARQLSLPDDLEESTPGEFVVAVYLEHYGLVRWCHDTSWHRKLTTYHDHLGKRRRQLSEAQANEATSVIAEDLADVFEDAERSRAVEVFVHLDEARDTVVFTVTHGRLYRKDGSIERNLARGAVAYRPDRHDVLVYDNRKGVLSVNAETAPIRAHYLSIFGQHLFGDREFFTGNSGVYTLERLVDLVESGIVLVPGVEEARLVEVKIESAASPGVTTIHQAKQESLCLLELVRNNAADAPDPGSGEIVAAALMLKYSSGGQARRIEVKPPQVAKYDRNQHADVTRHLLEANHFVTRKAMGRRRVG